MIEKQKIMIVDDSPDNVDILQEMLEDYYVLDTAFSGEECLEKVSNFLPGVILLDVMMPGMGGCETCRKLRERPELGSTKILFLSAKAQLKDKLDGYSAGGDDYVTKPFDKDYLLAKIRAFFRLIDEELMLIKKTSAFNRLLQGMKVPLDRIRISCIDLKGQGSLSEEQKILLTNISDSVDHLLGFQERIHNSSLSAG